MRRIVEVVTRGRWRLMHADELFAAEVRAFLDGLAHGRRATQK